MVYKVCTRAQWRDASLTGVFTGAPVDLADGFFHFSTASQLHQTLKLHFSGQNELCLLAVKTDALGAGLRWEISRGGALFPHLYEPLMLKHVIGDWPINVAADGTANLPGGL